jgi:hypothetical protein
MLLAGQAGADFEKYSEGTGEKRAPEFDSQPRAISSWIAITSFT